MRVIVGVSGGKASAWSANWALQHFSKEDVILYFNDTKWEHHDTYRFLEDLSTYWGKEIVSDSDGRSPEELFYDNRALANNRMPFCSRILKAKRLQAYFADGDTLVFGIGPDEPRRAERLVEAYRRTRKRANMVFPLIDENVTSQEIDYWLTTTGIEAPLMYRLGFKHNNCSGGCIRAGKKHWKLLLEKLPEVYADRERVEREMRKYLGKNVSFFKDETLEDFRKRMERGNG